MRKTLVAITTAAFFLSSAGLPANAATTYSLSVEIDGGWEGVGDTKAEAKSSCKVDEYEVIGVGTRLVVRSSSNKILGTKALNWKVSSYEENVWPIYPETDLAYTPKGGQPYFVAACRLSATIKVPKSSFYQLKLGIKDGGTYSFNELKSDKWKLVLSYN